MQFVEIDGERFLTIKEFARLLRRSDPTIRKLIEKGSHIRRLKTKRSGGHVYIHFDELTDFPFTDRFAGKLLVHKHVFDEEQQKYVRCSCDEDYEVS